MNEGARVLLVDDDADLLQLLNIRLKREGYEVQTASDARQALDCLSRQPPGAVITDLKMSRMDGMELLAEIERQFPVLPVIVLTAHGTIPDAVEATQRGAFAFLTKPIKHQELLECLQKALSVSAGPGDSEASGSREEVASWRSEILTRSPVMEALLHEAAMAGRSDASILIRGESGTGKELLARAMHKASPRREHEFVTVNCTAIPETLFESEVFGHVKGAFTGAHRDRSGLFSQADRGTLFLDEVGDMPLAVQVKLLRALQEGSIRPVGSEKTVDVNVRVIAATHRNLEKSARDGGFREDLYYRLNVVSLHLPALSERREDIPLLAHHFLKLYRDDGVATGFSRNAMERLVGAPWPGNIRQLGNLVHHCMVLSRSELIPDSLVQHALRDDSRGFERFADARDRFEREYLGNLLKATGGNVSHAARLADRNRSEFYKLLKKHALDPEVYREEESG